MIMDLVSASVFLFLIALLSILLRLKAFDISALIIALIYGYFILSLRGVSWFVVLLVFLISALYATYLGTNAKGSKLSRRGVDNVVSNGLVAFISSLLNMPAFFIGSISAALSDTMSSEIGMLSRNEPFLITNPKKHVPKGTNGAVSILGFFAGLMGGMIIGAISVLLMGSYFDVPGIKLFFVVTISGFLGTVADSFLGLLENRGVLSNGTVNFTSTLVGGLLCSVLL